MNTRLYPRPDEPIGYRRDGRPIYPQAGGSQPTLEIEPDDDAADGDPGDGSGGDNYTPPSRAEWLRVQNSLVKANASAKSRREAAAEKDRQIAQLQAEKAQHEAEAERRALAAQNQPPAASDTGGRKGKKSATPPAPAPAPGLPDGVFTKAQLKQMTAEAAQQAAQQAAEKFQAKIVSAAARAALVDAGAPKSGAAKLVNMLDLDSVEIDDDGEVVGGLEEQVEELKATLPQLFAAVEPPKTVKKRVPVTRATAAGRSDDQPRPQTSADKMAAQILGTR